MPAGAHGKALVAADVPVPVYVVPVGAGDGAFVWGGHHRPASVSAANGCFRLRWARAAILAERHVCSLTDLRSGYWSFGTSQLADILGEHPQIHRIPIETRFIVDPGGLRDLADTLSIRYDPYVGDDALRRLSDILTVRLAGRRDRDRGHTVPEAIGERHYWDAVGRLWSELVAGTFDESVPAAGSGHAAWPAGPFEPRSIRRAVPRYFRDRRELLGILRRAVDTMFGGAARDAGKPTWCEKTPFNLLCMDFLWELVPEASIVHIKRHPVAVVASHVDQPWAPPTVEGALAWLRPVYDRWLAWKATADLAGRRYVEVRAEDLAANWPEQRRALFELLGVDDFATSSTFESQRLEKRHHQFDRRTRDLVERTLGEVIPAMGY